MSAQKRSWQELGLVCRTGAGIEAVAHAICRIVREIVGADAAALFWLDIAGKPEGYFHEQTIPEANELFTNHFERLFSAPNEITVFALAQRRDRPAGHLIEPDKDYYRSNTFNLLVKASGYHHTLDLRVDVDGRARLVVLLFRKKGRPFDDGDSFVLKSTLPYLQKAARTSNPYCNWYPDGQRGEMIVDGRDLTLIAMNDAARRVLGQCTLMGQDVSFVGVKAALPAFIRTLCLQTGQAPPASTYLTMPAGRLHIVATLLGVSPGETADRPPVLVSLQIERLQLLKVIEKIISFDLSPLQTSIALQAGLGKQRSEAPALLHVSKEALKKHLREIYSVSGTSSWEDLARTLA